MSENRRKKRKAKQLTEKAEAQMDFMKDVQFVRRLDTETSVMEIFVRRKKALRSLWGPPIVRYYKRLLGINPFEQLMNLEKHYGSISPKTGSGLSEGSKTGSKRGTDSQGKG